ncbi:tRNA (adenosine(37)-N6)-dimethylallyltransferase MiaA [Sporolactobacillus sp. THM19-2]|uniref:tRNA (adenosine(37)-N6)-dimethylallyltransferase MiaA n=1 Tax=Sporolactobacillus sp. THM19-2 TaxID=2511171 RepID=UPI00102297E4|nr:tRNA (adenosine(37)-N6)-dimethylallyltransferase MiaA [Sporolactobacillus sp. THM19-2]RYL92233.1 tRNA (adenosine(37)-N6)-dimethylallyltransferase MiaA [Sporolactobacillus sp. THM19-2]
MHKQMIAVVGPTAVGKTKLSIFLAKHLKGEIINGDAFQVYRGLDIGTAKISTEETEGVPHHLFDIRNPGETYSAADYQKDARQIIREIQSRGNVPILVGGTGFYVKSALFDYHFSNVGSNPEYRMYLEEAEKKKGSGFLYEHLKSVDPDAACHIHPNNLVRVIRALEVTHETGIPFSRQQKQVSDVPLFHVMIIGLTMARELLYERINQRVNLMMGKGLLHEVQELYEKGLRDSQAMQAIGYKEFFPYFDGKITLDQAVDQLKKNSRHYAKRQLTWFRRQMDVSWFDMTDALSDFSIQADKILQFVQKKMSC